MPHSRSFRVPVGALIAAAALLLTSVAAAADEPPTPIDDENLLPTSEKFGEGQNPHPAARTIQHWSGETTNPLNGVTYSYSMVGADPASNDAATIDVDIVPIDITVRGRAFNGSDVIPAVLASPLFQAEDYSSTGAASTRTGGRGAGGELSAGNDDVQLQDATMRSQFNKVGTDYHLYLAPRVRPPVTIDVPASAGTILISRGGVANAAVDETWFQPQVEHLNATLHYLQPHRLALFVTNDVMLYVDHIATHCCVFGAHGAVDTTAEGHGSDGRQSLQTFVWSSWMTAGFFSPRLSWTKQDINGLSHEIAEWADDPFGTNLVQPWFSTVAPQYGCNNLLETGDPTVNIGFSAGANTFDQNAFTDGTYHPQDEAFLPWFMRTAPNDVSQPAQSDSAAGRYTLMGDLNPFALFHRPPPGC